MEKSPERKNALPRLLEYIRFVHMSRYFLLDVVPHLANKYPEVKDLILDKRKLAIQYMVGGAERYFQVYPKLENDIAYKRRKNLADTSKFSITHTFTDMSSLTTTSRLYSKPFLFYGYEFYYFIRSQPLNSEGGESLENYTIAGFLRCTSAILPPRHYLPVSSTVAIKTQDGSERKFNPSRVVFEASEKAIGGKLTLQNENLTQIINGTSPLVVKNTMSVTIEIELLESPTQIETCQEINDVSS